MYRPDPVSLRDAAEAPEVAKLNFNQRMVDPNSPERRPRRAAYVLPTFFTAGNIFLGYISVIQSFQGAMRASGTGIGAEPHFELAAKCIGIAVFLDGLDGRCLAANRRTSERRA